MIELTGRGMGWEWVQVQEFKFNKELRKVFIL